MKLFILLFLICTTVAAESNCRKWVIADKILGNLTHMADIGDSNCAEAAQMWQEEFDLADKFISCDNKNMNKMSESYQCYRTKQMTDELMADIDELPWIRICKRYRPQLDDLYNSGCRFKNK